MRFTSAIVAGLVAVAYAQTTGDVSTADSTTAQVPTPVVSMSPEQSSSLACLKACTAGDVDCEAKCVPVPNPNSSMIADTQDCIANCPKGNGTEADNKAYSDCQSNCIGQFYYTATGQPGGAAATNTASGSAATGGSATKSGSSSGTAGSDSTSATGSSSTGDAGSGAGVFGVSTAALSLAAFLAACVAL